MSCRWSPGAVGMRGSQQIVTPARRHAPSRLSCPLDCSQDQARPAAEAHTQSAAHSDPRCAWCATRSLYYTARANVTTLICRAANVTFLAMAPAVGQQQGPWPRVPQGGPPQRRFSQPVLQANNCLANLLFFFDGESRGWCKVKVGVGVGVRTGVGTGVGVGVGHTGTGWVPQRWPLVKDPCPCPHPYPHPYPYPYPSCPHQKE